MNQNDRWKQSTPQRVVSVVLSGSYIPYVTVKNIDDAGIVVLIVYAGSIRNPRRPLGGCHWMTRELPVLGTEFGGLFGGRGILLVDGFSRSSLASGVFSLRHQS
jgi:hypothetical protein